MMKNSCKLLSIIFVMCLISCQTFQERETKFVVKEWIGKKIYFSASTNFSVYGNDTTCLDILNSTYKILLYIDSTGCTSCRLKWLEWKYLINEFDTITNEKVGFIFVISPKKVNDVTEILKYNKFDYPVMIDSIGITNQINHFPLNPSYQCFLLNKDFEVQAIGNPIYNNSIKDLYRQLICKVSEQSKNKILQTKIEVKETKIDIGAFPVKSEKTGIFHIKNVGDSKLIIHNVSTTCGCTKVSFDQEPINPGKTTKIKVTMNLDEPGSFLKSITVYTNSQNSAQQLMIKGNAY